MPRPQLPLFVSNFFSFLSIYMFTIELKFGKQCSEPQAYVKLHVNQISQFEMAELF